MDRNIAAALVALALPGSLHAEPALTEEALAEPLASDIVRWVAFAEGDARSRDLRLAVSASAIPDAVLDWQSPVFVWVEPGYVYAETSIAFE